MAKLSDTKARNIKPEDKPFAHGSITGLSLHPSTQKGKGKWVLRYVSPVTNKRRNAGLGTYPEISILEAGQLGMKFRSELSKGIDPLEEKCKKEKIIKNPTFSECAVILHKELLPSWKNYKHGQQWINTLRTYAFPIIGNMMLNQIQPKDVADVLRKIWLEKPETAMRLKQRIHAVMSWGWARGYCASNPVDVVNYLLPPQPSKALRTAHHPAMDWRDIPEFITTYIHACPSHQITPKIIEFLILTACRSGEVRGMRWNEIDVDNKVWTIPAHRMKAKILHRVPLSKRALDIIVSQTNNNSEFVFPSTKGSEISDACMTVFIKRREILSTEKGRLATIHGFRSSFRDWCSENGYPQDLAEKSLAHSIKNKVEAAYHRTDLLEQRRSLMADWAKFCCNYDEK
ncbi:tyrosine-type recombinase/integrase [Orbus wheelerorum]|uniref:tyrosine-type recombinase/integrase n=1 Tax=Orbus wheelerorum TaxID=3074111 RepID=UPI00370DBB6D